MGGNNGYDVSRVAVALRTGLQRDKASHHSFWSEGKKLVLTLLLATVHASLRLYSHRLRATYYI
jgi:hypothetical protein